MKPNFPAPRSTHSANMIDPENMLIFGGEDMRENELNDLWSYNIPKKAWLHIPTKDCWPSPRTGHSAVLLDGYLYVFGGSQKQKVLDCLWRFSVRNSTWDEVKRETDEEKWPAGRCKHAACKLDGKMYIFSGWNMQTTFTDAWVFDPKECSWTRTSSNIPPRVWHKALSAPKRKQILIILGEDDKTFLREDSFVFSMPDCKYKALLVESQIPPRFGHCAVVWDGFVYVFGGYCGNMDLRADLWRYKLDDGDEKHDTSASWLPIQAAVLKNIQGRDGASMVVSNGRLLIFGGRNAMIQRLDDLVEIDLSKTEVMKAKELKGPKYGEQLAQLKAMGFDSFVTEQELVRVLDQVGGSVPSAIEKLYG